MKKVISCLMLVALLAACSSPKYTYYFDRYDYNSGKKHNVNTTVAQTNAPAAEASPLILEEQQVVASADNATPAPSISTKQKRDLAQKISSMTKEERKELKQTLKNEIKKATAQKKFDGNSVKEKKAWDYDLKMAAIFGAVGLVLTALGGVSSVFWVLGAIALVVGIVFLIKWLARQ